MSLFRAYLRRGGNNVFVLFVPGQTKQNQGEYLRYKTTAAAVIREFNWL